ncbi:hypothetical protein PUNSTDRAFT_21934, partial [Punctularia strigosozonata HHB-11173 SS5]
LRPACLARHRLLQWRPAAGRTTFTASGEPSGLAEHDLQRVRNVMASALADSTTKTYGAGLLAFHAFCDERRLSEAQRAPASADVMQAFLASLAGMYAGTTLTNYFYGVRAWHLIHGLSWDMNEAATQTMFRAIERLAPASSRRKKRAPVTEEVISKIRQRLDTGQAMHAAVFACLT